VNPVNALLARLKMLLSQHYSLLSILVGSALITFTIGPFNNWDTSYEFSAAQGVLLWGFPYTNGAGTMINQPPLGFYLDSPLFQIFGLSFNTGVAIITCFGLGSVLLVYLIGKTLYGKTTGLVASALFALAPWQIVFSRTFLIDVQCLFFSLLFLLIGIYAIRKDSVGLFMLSGAFLGAAFLTKFYGIFMIFPLAIFYFKNRKQKLRNRLVPVAFFVPLAVFLLIWYEGVCGINILTIFWQDDFKFYNAAGSLPSSFFTFNFFVGNLGIYLLAATIISMLISVFQTKLFRSFLGADLICVAAIFVVVGVDTFFALGLNYSAPYTGAVKYDYQSLPFFCLLAAALGSKTQSLFLNLKKKLNLNWLFFGIACAGALSAVVAIFANFFKAVGFGQLSYLVFTVEGSVGYSFFNSAQIAKTSSLVYVQYVGFAIVLSGLLWLAKDKVKPMANAWRLKM
jgi:4-amino-4-deoxy-L-arabinose transferase-like glycosyltransferase